MRAALANTPSKSGITPSAISLPSGPGSIEGLGESFEPQLNMGNGHYALGFKLPPGRAGFAPALNLAYDSGNGNGVAGVGWRLSERYIKRQSDKGLPAYGQADYKPDTFINESGEELVRVEGGEQDAVQVFRLKNEGAFQRYVYHRQADRWEVTDRTGIRHALGARLDGGDATARVRHPDRDATYAWYLAESADLNGNRIRYDYVADQGQVYCKRIRYGQDQDPDGPGHQVTLTYALRPDPVLDYRPAFRLATRYRLDSVDVETLGRRVRRYQLDYLPHAPVSRLLRFTVLGSDGQTALPPAEFRYTDHRPVAAAPLQPLGGLEAASLSLEGGIGSAEVYDFDGDGLPDLYQSRNPLSPPDEYDVVYRNQGGGVFQRIALSQADSAGLDAQAENSFLKDIDGDGFADLVAQTGFNPEDLGFRRNVGGRWDAAPPTPFQAPQGATLGEIFNGPEVRSADLDGDKQVDTLRSYVTRGWLGDGVVFSAYLNQGDGRLAVIPQTTDDILQGVPGTFASLNGALVLGDVNGDRLQDLVWLKDWDQGGPVYWPAMGWGRFDDRQGGYVLPLPAQANFGCTATVRCRVELGDLNDDGLADLYLVEGAQLRYWLNEAGKRFGAEARLQLDGQFEPSVATYRLMDVDGDRLQELLFYVQTQPTPDSLKPGFGYVRLFRDASGQLGDHQDNDGDGLVDEADEGNGGPNLLSSITNGIGRTLSLLYDSHITDLRRDRAAGQDWPNAVPFPMAVLRRLDVHDGTQTYTTRFEYHEGYYDGREKEFRGFARAEKRELGDVSAPDRISRYRFDTGVNEESLKGKPLELATLDATGKSYQTETYAWSVRALASGSGGDDRDVRYPTQTRKTRRVTEGGQGAPVTLQWDYEFDDYGNTTRTFEQGRLDADWDDERVTDSVFSAAFPAARARWILDKPVETHVADENGLRVSQQRRYYDGASALGEIDRGNVTRVEDWVEGERFVPSQRSDYDAYGNAIALYDPLYDAGDAGGGHRREVVYDPTLHTYPIEERIDTGATVLVMRAEHDPGFGVIKRSTDFNGFTTTYDYDVFGRLTALRKPPDTGNTVEYGYTLAHRLPNGDQVNWIDIRQRERDGGGTVDSRQFFDGLGRKVMTRGEGEEPGQIVVSDTVRFNAHGQAWRNYLPYFETGGLDYVPPSFASAFVEHRYDALGRETRTLQPDGAYALTDYEPLARRVCDEEQTRAASPHAGAAMRYVEDGLLDDKGAGRLRQVEEIVRIGDDGAPLSSPVTWTTRYRYDLQDNLTGYTDSQGNQKTLAYDGLGRKVFMDDPDRGHMQYAYDDAGNLTRTTDARNQTLRYTYDGANRLRAEFHGPAITAEVEYHYDSPAGPLSQGDYWLPNNPDTLIQAILGRQDVRDSFDRNQDGRLDVADVVKAALEQADAVPQLQAENTRGFLAWVRDQSGEEHHAYDARGRQVWTIKRLRDPSGGLRNFYTGMSYDSMDRVATLTYPDQTRVNYAYNTRGLLESIPGVIDRYDYNPVGQNLGLDLANGVSSSYEYDARQRLAALNSRRPRDGRTLQSFRYQFDGVSNITAIAEGRSAEDLTALGAELGLPPAEAARYHVGQTFRYDSLYRLTQAGNPAVYGTIDYRYDRIGNLLRQQASLLQADPAVNLGAITNGGSAGTKNRSGRQPGDPPGPHALTGTASPAVGALTYDDNGNVTREGGKTLNWDAKDRLAGLQSDRYRAAYTYDYTDTRKIKQVADNVTGASEATLYIDKFSELRNGRLTKYLYAGAHRVARSVQTGGEFQPDTWYLHDHLGSTHLALASDGKVLAQMVNYPYGRARQEKQAERNSGVVDYKFTGKETDQESELQYFEARLLSSVFGRFISVDKCSGMDLKEMISDTQSLSGYSYSKNQPINLIDPDGNFAIPAAIILFTTYMMSTEPANAPSKNTELQKGTSPSEGLAGIAVDLVPIPHPKIPVGKITGPIKQVIEKVYASEKKYLKELKATNVISGRQYSLDKQALDNFKNDAKKIVQKTAEYSADKLSEKVTNSIQEKIGEVLSQPLDGIVNPDGRWNTNKSQAGPEYISPTSYPSASGLDDATNNQVDQP